MLSSPINKLKTHLKDLTIEQVYVIRTHNYLYLVMYSFSFGNLEFIGRNKIHTRTQLKKVNFRKQYEMQTYRVNRFNFENLPNVILSAIFGLLTTTVI